MRMDQWIGLTDAGAKYLERFELEYHVQTITFWFDPNDPQAKGEQSERHGRGIPPWQRKVILNVEGAWDDYVGSLHEYTVEDKEGNIVEYAKEVMQAEPWSSGPCYFIALQDRAGQWIAETLWSQEELDNA